MLKWALNLNLSIKFGIMIIFILAIMTSSITFVFVHDQYQSQLSNLEDKGQALGLLLSKSISQQLNPPGIQALLDELIKNDDIAFATLRNADNKPIAHVGNIQNQTPLINQFKFEIATPLELTLTLGLSREKLETAFEQNVQEIFFVTIIIVGFLTLIIYLDFMHFVIKPLRSLTLAVADVTQGKLNIKLDYEYSDELGKLSQAFNHMANQLEQSISEKDKLAQKLAQTNQSLEKRVQESIWIMRDLHDDVGANLLTLVHCCKTPENIEIARKALQNLRETIRGLGKNETQIHLSDALASWYEESRQRLQAANMELLWEQNDACEVNLNNRQAINLSRIIRESISNSIKHSGSKKIKVEHKCFYDQIQIRIQDFGETAPPQQWQDGTGLNNIKTRAAELNAPVSWLQSDTRGTIMEIACPLTSTG